MHEIFRYVDRNRDRFLGELFALLRQPSISAQNLGVAECATLLKSQLEAIGVAAQIFPTTGHPVVFGEVKAPGAKRTILIYGHYDVQPTLWSVAHASLEPTIRTDASGDGDRRTKASSSPT
jgi:acetylornithine deacetylase/succinyl-diaminopimelate desuccinylase-like protein